MKNEVVRKEGYDAYMLCLERYKDAPNIKNINMWALDNPYSNESNESNEYDEWMMGALDAAVEHPKPPTDN